MARKTQVLPGELPSVPTYRTVCARFSLPAEAAEAPEEALALQAETLTPFEEGAYAFGFEAQGRTPAGETAYWVAVGAEVDFSELWHDALKSRGLLGAVRLDLAAFGWLRAMRERLPALERGVWLAALRASGEQLLLLLAEGRLAEMRALPPEAPEADFAREAMLLLAQAPMAGVATPAQAVCFSAEASAGAVLGELLGAAPRHEALPPEEEETFLQRGLRLRAEEGATFDLTPQSWRDEAKAARQRRVLAAAGALFGVAWLACAATLFLLPKIYAHKVEVAQAQLRAQGRAYQEVLDLRDRVELIERYQDRRYSALEILRLLCEAKTESMLFLSLTYRQKQVLRLTGTADATADVYAFKDALQKDERVREVKINRLTQDGKTRKQRFDVDLVFAVEEEA